VASALAQEVVGRVVSGLVLLAGTRTGTGKREEKAPGSRVQAGAGPGQHNAERFFFSENVL
jgi:hypothetical protein